MLALYLYATSAALSVDQKLQTNALSEAIRKIYDLALDDIQFLGLQVNYFLPGIPRKLARKVKSVDMFAKQGTGANFEVWINTMPLVPLS